MRVRRHFPAFGCPGLRDYASDLGRSDPIEPNSPYVAPTERGRLGVSCPYEVRSKEDTHDITGRTGTESSR